MLKTIKIYKEDDKIYGKFERKDKKTYTFILEDVGDRVLTDKIILKDKKYAIKSIVTYGFKRLSDHIDSRDQKEAMEKIAHKFRASISSKESQYALLMAQ